MGEIPKEKLNGIDTEALKSMAEECSEYLARAHGRHLFVPEPNELLGEDTAANPQEYLMGAMNACILNTYVIAAAMKGIKLERVVMETEGELDLRGFLGIDKNVIPGYKELKYKVRLQGDGTKEQYEEVHKTVVATSPNYYNISRAIELNTELIVE